MTRLQAIREYVFWLAWAVIVGGVALVAVQAPLAFHAMPGMSGDPAAAWRHASVLMTLTFGRFLPMCAGAALALAALEAPALASPGARASTRALQAALLAANAAVWCLLAFKLAPEMAAMALGDPAEWAAGEARALFNQKHQLSARLTQAGLLLTLAVPAARLARRGGGAS